MKTCNDLLLPIEQKIFDALKLVIDPEIGENIVDLGLVYGIEIKRKTARVNLTTTTPACPIGEMLSNDVYTTLIWRLPIDMKVDVNLVWDPPWNPSMISVEAKHRLGWD